MTWDARTESKRMDQLAIAETENWRDPDCRVRYFNKYYEEQGIIGDYIDLTFEFKRNDIGALSLTLKGDDPCKSFIFDNPDGADATIPIVVDTKGTRWPGKIDRAAIMRDEEGTQTIEISALHDWNHVATTCCWASPFAPLEAQFPRHMVQIGPTISCVKTYLMDNLVRLQLPLWGQPVNWGDAPDWFQNGDAMFPIAVVPVNPYRDTSKWCAMTARFEMADELIAPVLKDAGLVVTVNLFLPDEDEQPAPLYYWLDQPTIVIDVVDKSGIVGATGTMVDGLISWFEEWVDEGQSSVLHPILDPELDYENDYTYGTFGTLKEKPWVVWREGQYSGIGKSELALHKPLAMEIIVGGRSPGWVNAGIEIAMKNMLAWIGLLIGVPGLDALYMGQLDDVFLAFGKHIDPQRIRRAGPYAYREHFVTGSDKAWTLDGFLAGRQGIFDTRGYVSNSITVEDHAPYIYGTHFEVGDQVGFEIAGYIFTDYVTAAVFQDNRETATTWTLTIGDGADEEAPMAAMYRKFTGLTSIVKQSLLDVGADLDLILF